jgi:hypothetical protein
VQECALAFEYARHERAQRLGADQDQGEKDGYLQNSSASHIPLWSSEPLRMEKRKYQINEQPE